MSPKHLAAVVALIFITSPNFVIAAETASGSGSSTGSVSGVQTSGDLAPTIHYSKLPTQALPTKQATPQSSDLPQILEAMGALFAPKTAAPPAYGPLSEIATPDATEPAYGSGDYTAPVATRDLGPQKIVATFNKYFDTCAQKLGLGSCRFVNMGIMGDDAHKARLSCHNSGEAIDVGPLTCSSGRYIKPGDPMFFEFGKCLAHDSNNELEIIYNQAEPPNMIYKKDHNNHLHIQLKNCNLIHG